MSWFNRTNHQKQIGNLQQIFQDENDVFHMAIIALERLEQCLNNESKESHLLVTTAIGTKGDYHTEETNKRDKKGWIEEILLHCQTIYLNSDYDDKDIFDAGAKMFIENLLEWYAGRKLLSYYDTVDSCVIPIIIALSHQKADFEDVFKKYVCDIFSDDTEASLEQKFERTKEGFNAYQSAQYILEKEQQRGITQLQDAIYSHKRGKAQDGYRRIINGLTSSMCGTAAPAKLFYKIVAKHLPDIANSIPEINEASIDKIFESKTINENIPFTEVEKNDMENKMEWNSLYPKLEAIIGQILDVAGIKYNEITIKIR